MAVDPSSTSFLRGTPRTGTRGTLLVPFSLVPGMPGGVRKSTINVEVVRSWSGKFGPGCGGRVIGFPSGIIR